MLVTPAASAAVENAPAQAPQGGTIVYYGSTPEGRYFQTLPLDAGNSANLDVARPDLTLPQDPNAHGTVTPGRHGPIPGYCWIKVNPIGFDVHRQAMYAGVDQDCEAAIRKHWMRARFDRTAPNGWQPYTTDLWADPVTARPWLFLFDVPCHVGAGAFSYITNAEGFAEDSDGAVIRSGIQLNQITPGNCGSVA